jgi:uncharacterized protein
MRKSKYEIRDREAVLRLLHECEVGRLGTVTADGYPMIKPINVVYYDGAIYFHTATEGEKIDDIRRDSRVCFEADRPSGYRKAVNQPCEATYTYRSVIIRGRATIVASREQKMSALDALMKKYQPEGGHGQGYPEQTLQITGVVRIDIDQMTGKETTPPSDPFPL